MKQFLLLILSAALALAQKGDALVPSIGFPVAYPVSCSGVHLPADAYLLRVKVTASNCDGVGLGTVPVGWLSLFAGNQSAWEVTLYPGSKTKLEERRALSTRFDRAFLVYPKEVDDEWVAPVVVLEFEYWSLTTGESLLKIDQFEVVEEGLKPKFSSKAHSSPKDCWPNQSMEPTVTAVTPRADARVAPAATVAHH